jgi:hypothetical protein
MSNSDADADAAAARLLAEIAEIELYIEAERMRKRQVEVNEMIQDRQGRSIRRMSVSAHNNNAVMVEQFIEEEDEEEYYEQEFGEEGAEFNEEVTEPMKQSSAPTGGGGLFSDMMSAVGQRQQRVATELPVIPISKPKARPAVASGGGLFSDMMSAVGQRQERVATELPVLPVSKRKAQPAAGGLFSDMMSAVGQREKRVEDGSLYQQEIVQQPAKAASFDLAAMVSNAARDREARLEAGGEKKVTVIRDREEYKDDFNNVALEAAELGRLTRLNEYIVEAVAVEKKVKEAWQSKGLMAIDWRTQHMSIIHEAAKLGEETRLREYVVSNCDEEEDEYWAEGDHAFSFDRMAALEKLEQMSKVEQHMFLQKILDQEDGTRGIVRPMYMYNDIRHVVLPKGRLPKLDQTKAREELSRMDRPLSNISNEVMAKAKDRRRRLEMLDEEPHMRAECDCGYCGTASPFQTFAYRVVEGRVKGAHIPEELQKELTQNEGKRYKVLGKGGKTRITRALKTDTATGEIDKEQHFYTKQKQKQAEEAERARIAAIPRSKRGRITRTGEVLPIQPSPDRKSTQQPTPVAKVPPTSAKVSTPVRSWPPVAKAPPTIANVSTPVRSPPPPSPLKPASPTVSADAQRAAALEAEIAAMQAEIDNQLAIQSAAAAAARSPAKAVNVETQVTLQTIEDTQPEVVGAQLSSAANSSAAQTNVDSQPATGKKRGGGLFGRVLRTKGAK